MLMRGDFNLTSLQRLIDLQEEDIKQTMLKQDTVFRNQVHELHRLYGVQKSLMMNLGCEEGDQFDSWNVEAQYLLPLTNKFEPAKEMRFSSIYKVDLVDGCEGTSDRFRKKPLDLQLPADEFISLGEENPPKRGRFVNFFKGPVDYRHPIFGSSSEAEDINLSLSLGENRIVPGGKIRTCVIDLEEPENKPSDRHTKRAPPSCEAAQTSSKDAYASQVSALSDIPLFSNSLCTSRSSENARISSCQEYSECIHEKRSEGTRECYDDVPHTNLSAKIQQVTSYQEGSLDLNRIQLYDASCFSNDGILTSLSTASSSGVSAGNNGNTKKENCFAMCCINEFRNCSDGTPSMIRKGNVVNLAALDIGRDTRNADISDRNATCNGTNGSITSLKDSMSMSLPPVGVPRDFGSCSGDHGDGDVELMLKVDSSLLDSSDRMSKATTTRAVSCEKSEVEDTVFSCIDQGQNTWQDGNGIKSPASVKSYSLSDNDSSNVWTMQSGVKSCGFNQHPKIPLEVQMTDVLSGDCDMQISDSSESKSGHDKEKKAETFQADDLVQSAAESLIHMYLDNAACRKNLHTEMGSEDIEAEKESSQKPQHSCDSFELITLNLTESDADSKSIVSSNAYEVNYADTKDFGVKLKRGRRMKDFQKEILPSLASLARHEIHEDINIMEGVLRSREYRKMRANATACKQGWSAPVRSRRSRLNYVRRRNLS